MTKVTKLFPSNAADKPDNVLEMAMGQYKNVVVIGWGNDDRFDARADNGLSVAECNWLCDKLKQQLLNCED